jgi:hypothetical protein
VLTEAAHAPEPAQPLNQSGDAHCCGIFHLGIPE